MSTYNQRLTINNTKIDEITEIARTLPPAGGSSDPNIFVQLEEPTSKNGIWLQINKTAEHFVSDDDVFVGGTFDDDASILATHYPSGVGSGNVVIVGNNIYLLGGEGSEYSNYKYDCISKTYTKMTNLPISLRYGATIAIGTDIYMWTGYPASSSNGQYGYKYDTLTDTYTQLAKSPVTLLRPCSNVGDYIYFFGRI